MNGANYATKRAASVLRAGRFPWTKQVAWLGANLATPAMATGGRYRAITRSCRRKYTGRPPTLRRNSQPLFVNTAWMSCCRSRARDERVLPQKGIYYFTEGASGELRAGNLKRSAITAKGFDADRSFMMIEIAGDELYFQTVSRMGITVDSGVIRRPIRPSP
jgi:hypothetical protein